MISSLPSAVVTYLSPFSIASGTAVTMRVDDQKTKLFKRVQIKRKDSPLVVVTLNDFAGDKFKVTVSLLNGQVNLLFPECADERDGHAVLLEVIRSIEKIFPPSSQ